MKGGWRVDGGVCRGGGASCGPCTCFFNSNLTKLLSDTFAEIVSHPNVFAKPGNVTVD